MTDEPNIPPEEFERMMNDADRASVGRNIDEIAQTNWKLFKAHTDLGFTDDQAFEITMAAMHLIAAGPDSPDLIFNIPSDAFNEDDE